MGFFDSITHGASNLFHGAVDTVSSAAHTVGSGVSSAYHALESNQREVSEGIHMAEEGIVGLVHRGEDAVRDGTHSLAAHAHGIPVLGTIADRAADAATFAAQVPGGAINAATRLVGGTLNAIEHPIDTVAGLGSMVEHAGIAGTPVRALHHAYNVASGQESVRDGLNHTFNPMQQQRDDGQYFDNMVMGARGTDGQRHGGMVDNYRTAIHEGRYGEIPGMLAVDVGSMFIGGEAAGATRGARAAAEGAELSRAAHVGTEAAEALRVPGARTAHVPPAPINPVAAPVSAGAAERAGAAGADVAHAPTMPDIGRSSTIPDVGRSSTIPDVGRSPTLPDLTRSPTLPDIGRSPTLPAINPGEALGPGYSHRPTVPGVGAPPAPPVQSIRNTVPGGFHAPGTRGVQPRWNRRIEAPAVQPHQIGGPSPGGWEVPRVIDRAPVPHAPPPGPAVRRVALDAAHDPAARAARSDAIGPLDVLGAQLEGHPDIAAARGGR